ncbi:ATP-binding sensor histidine kinase [Oceanobacillus polygoni]|uniref:histidine kinase n=1 Tax=Oceanobacillus polygoni TaxID=1235259 RepID=A0A9X0YSX2_9BACI|nr:ATP-binding sensor histidine kinase [Oceanobacillus polygoni]MBP2076730.1 putative ATPase/signal transduction histidine kinase [Oceanobacillus polygoni]
MVKLPGYRILDIVIENESWSLYKAFSLKDERVVAIKIENNQSRAEIKHDFHIAKDLNTDYILRPIHLEKYGEDRYIITESFQGETLEARLKRETDPLDLRSFLMIAARLADVVSKLHQAHIIHKSLHPQNILLESRINEIKVTGFHHATTLSKEMQQTNISPYQFRDQIAYMSPEQTGRMNRALDYRTDLYSLGIIYYEMITERLPFELEHPAELIHAHLAKLPESPSVINAAIPEPISTIIMRLLEKMPEYRYQHAIRLKDDLEKCLKQLDETGDIQDIELSGQEPGRIYEKSRRLYGREEIVEQLIESFYRVQKGRTELLLVPGPSGVGKTSVVHELHKPLVKEKGYFISGKFVQLEKQIPYAPIVHAFQGLLRQIVSEGQTSIQQWGRRLNEALGPSAGVIANFIPEISWLIGEQGDVPDLPPQGVHNRFRNAIRSFIRVFATKEHPLVLFLDDLQWADEATLDLLDYLVSNPEDQYVLIIAAYRDNEVHIGHPFEVMLTKLHEKDTDMTTIRVTTLQVKHVREWIYESFSLGNNDTEFLVQFIFRITQGNPFFIVQVIQTLLDEIIIDFHMEKGKWILNRQAMKQLPMSDSIIDFILKSINRLPKETIAILQLASCFGNRFGLKALAEIAKLTYMEVMKSLWHGLEAGLVMPIDSSYKWIYEGDRTGFEQAHLPTFLFVHDKIQQAFYTSLSKENQEKNHQLIGLELVALYDELEREAHIFEIVNHLNHSRNRLTEEQQSNLVNWNWMAGVQAKNRAAPDAALNFFRVGKELLTENRWRKSYNITFKIMVGLGETQYLNHLFEEAEQTFEEILKNAKTIQEKLQVYDLKILLYSHIHEVERATNTVLEGLKLGGWNFKSNPTKVDVAKEYLLTKLTLKKKKKTDLLQLPAIKNDFVHAMMRTLINSNGPIYHWNQNLATILMLRALRLTLKYGDMESTALVYTNYALTLSAGSNNYDVGYHFGKLAMDQLEKYQDTSIKATVYFIFGTFVNHWKRPVRENLTYLERSQQLCIESGNLHLAGANASFITIILLIKGDNLADVKKGIERQHAFAKHNEYVLADNFLDETIDWINVLSTTDEPVNWHYPDFTDDLSAQIIHYTLRLQMTYLLDNEKEAIAIMDKLDSLVNGTFVLIMTPDTYFYHGLWTTRLMRRGKLSKIQGRKKLFRKLKKMKIWAKSSPANYRHKYLLLGAEWMQIVGNDRAIYLYNRSIRFATESGFLQDIAIGNQCAAEFYLANKLPKSAKPYLVDASINYLKWGAKRVAYRLYQAYPELIRKEEDRAFALHLGNESLDMNTIFETSKLIMDEVMFDKLLEKFMKRMLVNAGAERVFLLLNKDDALQLVAINDIHDEIKIYEQPRRMEMSSDFSTTIVHYVANTQEAVVLDDAANKGKFTTDYFIKQKNAKSILCLPIIYHRKLTGVLYLENNKSTNVFTKERVVLLTLLASQVAISIENTYLYASLEAKVEERTSLLNAANERLKHANISLENAEMERTQFLTTISHDLRSPIATIQNYVDAILDGVVEGEQRSNYLQIVKKRLTSLNKLVQDLFDLAQFETGNFSITMDVVPIDQLFLHLCNQFELDVELAGLEFKRELSIATESDYPLVEVDVQRMEQVMSNLISNAIRYMEKGEIKLKLSLENEGDAIISIADEGSGIAPSDIPYVFDQFYTKGVGTKKAGHGLGLAICKEIMNAHKGKIWVESEEQRGTTFYLSMKVLRGSESEKEMHALQLEQQ